MGQAPFLPLARSVTSQSPLRAAITAAYRRAERDCLPALLAEARLDPSSACAARELAKRLVIALRARGTGFGVRGATASLLRDFPLSSQEGVSLMCLAEALLRIPDRATREALIRDKIAQGGWRTLSGHSDSLLAKAAAWGLRISGKLTAGAGDTNLEYAISRLIAKGGARLVGAALELAMRAISEQFVAGHDIGQALANARRYEARGFRYSYDMLGEAAITADDSERYLAAYESAIHSIGKAAQGRGLYRGPGISVKLSALHPRFHRSQRERVMRELLPRLKSLIVLARHHRIGLDIDAEEAQQLDLSLDIIEALCIDRDLEGWEGIGIAVQAYQKRAPFVTDWLIDLARRTRRRLMIRLVKGAYWDIEIKHAQVSGFDGYPCYTRKVYTDVCYLACASKLLAATDAVYPQFATHNAHTLAAVYHMAGPESDPGRYEFQCLHGMGEALYEDVVGPRSSGGLERPCRIYAPVGLPRTLLPYLVRRLLENGANTSFVHRVADKRVPAEDLIADPVALAQAIEPLGAPHPRIPLPRTLYGGGRVNSMGFDLSDERELASLSSELLQNAGCDWLAKPLLGHERRGESERIEVRNPADRRDVVGHVIEATHEDVMAALDCAAEAAPAWAATPPAERAAILERASDLIEAQNRKLMSLAVREAGKTLPNAVAEIRESVDFLRYYAAQIRTSLWSAAREPRGPVVCISPWNFPLAIFTGQASAALAAGNTVIAKPAEQTPLIAAHAVGLLHRAGVPAQVLQLLPGRGETIGASLVADSRVQAVMFTGSTEVAKLIQRSLAGRLDRCGQPVPFIAETGGQNAMIVDSSALPEQVVTDVLHSAFDSAGQRCSSLRLLCLQDESADPVLAMLKGALRELTVDPPDRLSTDVGPVIDEQARNALLGHIERMRARGRRIFQLPLPPGTREGTFVAPALIEIDSPGELQGEVFGPVLHLLRYRRSGLDALLEAIEAGGYGLTLGIQSRIDETIERIRSRARVGNIYVNRNMIGAVVGVQPFGGEGLSGPGPKAGGPLYLARLVRGNGGHWISPGGRNEAALRPARAYRDWLVSQRFAALADLAQRYLEITPSGIAMDLAGPTGERNTYSLHPRGPVLCCAVRQKDLLAQLAVVFSSGNRAVLVDGEPTRRLQAALPESVRCLVVLVPNWTDACFRHALYAGGEDHLRQLCRQIAARPGPIIGIQAASPGPLPYTLEPLLVERLLCLNTAAAGGNTGLTVIE